MSAPVETKPIIIDLGKELDSGSSGPDEVAHYVDQRFEQDVTSAMIMGTELVALCGHRWVPARDPQKLPVCQPCVIELDRIINS